jgi:hypothetical protein
MNSTESDDADRLSTALFDEVIVPTAEAARQGGAKPYFPTGRDPSLESYFVPCERAFMTPAGFEFPGDGGAGSLIDALAAHWRAEGESALTAVAPRLAAIAKALEGVGESDGSVDIFCYTLF